MNVSKGVIFSVIVSPESKGKAPILPVVFLMIVFITIDLRTYSLNPNSIHALQLRAYLYSLVSINLSQYFGLILL